MSRLIGVHIAADTVPRGMMQSCPAAYCGWIETGVKTLSLDQADSRFAKALFRFFHESFATYSITRRNGWTGVQPYGQWLSATFRDWVSKCLTR